MLSAYAAVIEQVSSEPAMRIHRRPLSGAGRRPSTPSGSSGPDLLERLIGFLLAPLRWMRDWWWGFSIRPIVRLFVETHVSARTSEMGRFLRPKRLMMAGGSTEDARLLDECLRSLGYAEGMVAGGSRSLGPIRYIPPVAFALSWILIALNPAFRQLQTELLVLVLYTFPFLMLLVYAIVVRFGFRWKRAFFIAWASEAVLGVDRTRLLVANKSASIYELESRVYADMGLRGHTEFPVDVILHPAPYLFLSVLPLFVVLLARGDLTSVRLWTLALVPVLLMLFFLVHTVGAVRRYRERRKAGLV